MTNALTDLFAVQYPIIQAGMVWCSGWRMAAASSNSGILGVIGSGSMYPDVLDLHISKCKAHTNKPYGVNIPLMYPDVEKHVKTIIRHKVPVVITSAGNPALYTERLVDSGITVLHVVSSARFAEKAQNAGVQGIICEGFEAGGHNGREETTTMCLVPQVRSATDLPLIAAGGIASGSSIYAAMALGADGVQIGSLFVTATESSAHDAFKQAIIAAKEGDTMLTLKELAPVRLMKNGFYLQVFEAYRNGASVDELRELLGRGRAKKGMFEGDIEQGELEIGQVSSSIDAVRPVADIVVKLVQEFTTASTRMREVKL
jgi:enoyl-[acyl-carrier protein] reductase II